MFRSDVNKRTLSRVRESSLKSKGVAEEGDELGMSCRSREGSSGYFRATCD